MNALLARLKIVAVFCGLGLIGNAAPARLEKAAPEMTELGINAMAFLAVAGADDVLVVHSVRSEDGQNVLEIEDVIYAPDGHPRYGLALIQHGMLDPDRADRWTIHEPGKQQYLQGVTLVRMDLGESRAELELSPVPGRARRHYTFRWEARLEKWSDVQRRYPQLPRPSADRNWRHQEVLHPRFAATAK